MAAQLPPTLNESQLRDQITDLCELADQLMAQLDSALGERRKLEAQLAACQQRIAALEAQLPQWTADEILRHEG